VAWGRVTADSLSEKSDTNGCHRIEVALRPGVTDPVGEQLVRAAHELGVSGLQRASTGQSFLVQGEGLNNDSLHVLARRLLANATIQRYTLGNIEPVFPPPATANRQVDVLPVRACTDAELLALSQRRRAALDLAEMQAIRGFYRSQDRDPTDVEFEMIAQTWSEHCVHKTFKARIQLENGDGSPPEIIEGLLNTYLRRATQEIAAPWVRSAFVDNAGIIDFDDEYEISFKVETHNHPSAIEPFGGANTGVGGVIRDVIGVSAKPIAATDVLCFGPQDALLESLPEGVLHPRRIRSGVVAGVMDYGNKIGIPTVNGAILYDPGYTANPLVFCGCLGLAPTGSHPKDPQPGDRVIVLGGRTGRDGLRGATFSSMTMDGQTGEVSGASVQIGNPIVEKGLIEVITRARDLKIYHAITDCGAGGLSSAVGELASGSGVQVELSQVPLKYPGLAAWEIWLSEAQERMVLGVPPEALPALEELCAVFGVEITDIGAFTASGSIQVNYDGQPVLDLPNEFLHHSLPRRELPALLPHPEARLQPSPPCPDFNTTLLALLSHPDIASKADVIRIYDHEVLGGTVVKPLTGAQDDGPSDGCVLKPPGTRGKTGIALANGIHPSYGKLDAYNMAVSAVDEAVRNAVAVGGDPGHLALLDNFCWGDPTRPETLGSLVAAARGCYAAARHYGAPFISGKDSLNNEYLGEDGQRHAIPPTLLISSLAIVPDVEKAVSMDLKALDDCLYRLGDFDPQFGGSHFLQMEGNLAPHPVPGLPPSAPIVYRRLHEAMQQGLVRACHDLSEGGLAVAAAEMCIGGRIGLELNLDSPDPVRQLFGETNGCLLVEIDPADTPAFESLFEGLPLQLLGRVVGSGRLAITISGQRLVDLSLDALVAAWEGQV
jgi:phosphoribosylformylglycinamidine synthase